MKTILYNPIFINPQAYYVFPRLTRWLRPDDSYKEPANYIGQIEVTIIAYGEIGYTEYFEHTNYIDFTNFSNSYVRISLFTRLGSCVLGEWKIGAMESDRPYIEPEVLASLKAVVIVGDKTNQDEDRDTVANLVDASNPFIISNAAYEGMSGYNGYPIILRGTNRTYQDKASYINIVGNDKNIISMSRISFNTAAIFSYIKRDGILTDYNKDIESFKVKITGIDYSRFVLKYSYISESSATVRTVISITSDGTYELPKSFASDGSLTSDSVWIGLSFTKQSTDIPDIIEDVNVTIEVLPSFEGAFVTDGVNDLITSTKTIQEMLGGNKELTVISMIASLSSYNNGSIGLTNYIRGGSQGLIRNNISNSNDGKYGIYGYSISNIDSYTTSNKVIKDILGDKEDYNGSFNGTSSEIWNNKFSVEGYISSTTGNTVETSKVAWYWTVIANKVLTTDQINQVIAYYDLDKYLEPTVLYNVKRQGLSNDTPASEWYLKDYSNNGYDMTLNNFSKVGGSGIAAKQGESIKDYSIIKDEEYQELTIYNEFKFKIKSKLSGRYWTVQYINRTNTSYPVTIVIDKDAYWVNSTTYYDADNNKQVIRKDIPIAADTPTDVLCCGYDQFNIPEDATSIVSAVSYINYNAVGEVTVELIPSFEGGLITDGVNDFGKVTGLPAYKDYTTIIDYQRFDIGYIEGKGTTGILSKAHAAGQGAFLMNLIGSTGTHMNSYSFGTANANTYADLDRQIYYQTKYKMQGFDMTAGTGVDSDSMWLALVRDNDSRFFNGVFYSLLMFPYSMSEFLIERQLKKHELGTLYPDMIELRPIIKGGSIFKYLRVSDNKTLYPGDYINVGDTIRFYVSDISGTPNEVSKFTVNGIEGTPKGDNGDLFDVVVTKSPQKIDITIDEYIRYEDIVQPYPFSIRIYDSETNHIYTWGDKLKIGSKVVFKEWASNLLPEFYKGFFHLNQADGSNIAIELNKEYEVFKGFGFTVVSLNYIGGTNEPKCILSPSRLRIPNSSYKILGYIPDISGHGNHGVIHNSAYTEGSGVNEDGSYQLDGVDDFISIPATVGGKQVIMKVIWNTPNAAILYDQRGYNNEFAIYNGTVDNDSNPVPAYQARNNGKTYIDGILNSNIKVVELRNINHIITITNELSLGENKKSPIIGCNGTHDNYFTPMSLYDFMLFDEISTDEEILNLNKYIGIEPKVTVPPYYWDAYGRSNMEAAYDRALMLNLGKIPSNDTSNALTAKNMAWDEMSGYGGYSFANFTSSKWTNRNRENGIEVISRDWYSFTAKRVGTGEYFYDFQNRTITELNKELIVKAISDKPVYVRWEFKYRTAEKPDVDSTLLLVKQAMTPNIPITVTLPYKTEQEKTDLGVTEGSESYLFYFDPSDIPVGEEYTVEMLPLYPNGLVCDGVTDYVENTLLPIFTDFTLVIKALKLTDYIGSGGIIIKKGINTDFSNAEFIYGLDSASSEENRNSFWSFGGAYRTTESTPLIGYMTKTNVNGNSITPGANTGAIGLTISKREGYSKMVFYKAILYPKTITNLEIMFLKNLFERDEIIDLTNPIFIQ